MKGTKKEKSTNGKSKVFSKPGGIAEKQKDLESLNSSNLKEKPGGKIIGKLPDGRTVVSRDTSTDQRPTLEIQERTPSGKVKMIKIRYNGE